MYVVEVPMSEFSILEVSSHDDFVSIGGFRPVTTKKSM
jgi:hypothetical protein